MSQIMILIENLSINIIQMFGRGVLRGLKTIDFYKRVPAEYSEGTVSGACISIVSITALLILSISAISDYMTPYVMTDLIMDVRHSQDPIKVSIDITFPKFPCAALSLDTQNVLKVHNLNIRDGVTKYILPDNVVYDDRHMEEPAKSAAIKQQIQAKKGCRFVGEFNVERVPGDFHFATHGYSHHMHQIMASGIRTFDLSHRIDHLYFGDEKPTRKVEKSLEKFTSQKEIAENFLGITYTYFLEIIPRNVIYSNGYHKQTFFYTARINELIMPSIPLVLFKFETNPMTEVEIGEYKPFWRFLIQLVAIIGGIFTVSSIVDQMVHSSMKFLLQKHRLNKLH